MSIAHPDSSPPNDPSESAHLPDPADYQGQLHLQRADLPLFFAGRIVALPVTLHNESRVVWPAAGDHPVRVAYHWLHPDGTLWVRDGRRTNLSGDLEPGGSIALEAVIEPPEEPGAAILQLTAVQERRSWFEPHGFGQVDLNVDILDFTEYARGSIEALHDLPEPRAGETVSLAVRLRNDGAQIWPAQGFYAARISYHWYSMDDHLVERDGLRTNLPADLKGGESRIMAAQVKMPPNPGTYILEWTVVQDRVAWLEESGTFQSARITVEVGEPVPATERDATAERAKALQAHAQEIEKWQYAGWIERYDTLHPEDVRLAQRLMNTWPRYPLISILMPCFNSPTPFLREAVESVLAQIYPYWELCIADDASTEPYVRPLLEEYAARDPRIRVTFREVNGHISAASNTALEMAQGEFCLLLDHDDRLAAHALFFVVGEILHDGRLEWIYYDEDKIDEGGRRFAPHFKCEPNPDLFLGAAYMAAHATYRTERLKDVGGFRLGYEGSQDHDLGLRVFENVLLSQIKHIPHILYHWRTHAGSVACNFLQKPYAYTSGVRAISDYLHRRGIATTVEKLHHVSGYRIRYHLPDPAPQVSIIIPTRDRLDLLRTCIASILHKTRYQNYEILIINNQSIQLETLRYFKYLTESGIAHIVDYDGPFNWSALNNFGVKQAQGELLCLLNNDTEVITESWLDEMVSHALRPDIGVVGAVLWYPDNRMQHGGVVLGLKSSVAGHIFTRLPRNSFPIYRVYLAQNYSAVTGACMVMRKIVFEAVGGMNECYLRIGLNDVDFCLRVQSELNLRVLWTPFAELYHHESASRGTPSTAQDKYQQLCEVYYMRSHWFHEINEDIYFNPNLALDARYIRADPPRITARKSLRVCQFLNRPKLAFIHIPKTAGSALRAALEFEYPGRALMVISGMENIKLYDGDQAMIDKIRRRASKAEVWFSHFSVGFGDLLDLDCVYLAILRDPVSRVVSHYRQLLKLNISPVNTLIENHFSFRDMISKGIIPGNLMVRKLLGERPEIATWDQIEKGGRAYAANFCGFSFPVEAWTGEDDKVLARLDQAPDNNPAWLEQVIATIHSQFAFVGRQEALDEQVKILGEHLNWDPGMKIPQVNVGSKKFPVELDDDLRQLIEEHNQLDRQLYDYISALPNGYWMNDSLIRKVSI